jgi:Icc-related predicted phosphoesterase
MTLQIAFAGDLRGALEHYHRLFERAWRSRLAAVILGGDLLPQPVLALGPTQAIAEQARFLGDRLRPLLRQLRRIAPRLRVLYLPGDEDAVACDTLLAELSHEGLLLPLHGEVIELGSRYLVGWAHVPLCGGPWLDRQRADLPADELPDATAIMTSAGGWQRVAVREALATQLSLSAELARLPATPAARTVLVSHAPPCGGQTDRLLDGLHGGSRALRAWIETHQPSAVLCSHCTDAPYVSGSVCERIGRCVVCNPGQGEQALHAVELDLADPRSMVRHSVLGSEHPFDGGPLQFSAAPRRPPH